jgi:chromosome partitioning protein
MRGPIISAPARTLLGERRVDQWKESPMRSIAVINQKGGVGKTTTAVNLSAALASAGQKVWLIDLDPQAHASLHLGFVSERGQPGIYDVLSGQTPIRAARFQLSDRLWLTPSHIDLAAAEMELAGEVGREILLRERLNDAAADVDYLVLDCPPSLGILTLNALTTVREVLLPLQPHFLALHGLSKLLHTTEVVAKRLNRDLCLAGVVFCMCDIQTRLANEVIQDVRAFFAKAPGGHDLWGEAPCFQTRVRRNIRLAEAPSFGRSIFEYAPQSHGAEDYRNLAIELHGRGASAAHHSQSLRAAG